MKLTMSLVTMLLVSSVVFGQQIRTTPVRELGTAASYPMDGAPFLKEQYRLAAEYIQAHPESAGLAKTGRTSWSFAVGSTHSWYTYNMSTSNYYQTASTCRKVGTHCYIFVEDSLWVDGISGRVTQAAVDSIQNDFDNKTPANATKGIFNMDSTAFGAPPDVDGDPKIIILILNIQDGYAGSGGYVAGFFDPRQETTNLNSNHADIYYIDANPTDLTTAYGIETAMSTTAHEFQHMINWNYHQTSGAPPTFINEGCSMLAELYCGYPPASLSLYANETNIYLFTWRSGNNTLVLNDYARAQRFNLYLWDRYGIGLFQYIAQNQYADPVTLLNDALTKDSLHTSFTTVFNNWLIANELNDTTSNRLYGYAYPGLPVSNGRTYYNPNISAQDTVASLGARYLIFKSGTNLSVTFQNPTSSAQLSVTAIEMGSGAKNVVNVPFGSAFSEPAFGSTYSTIAFVVTNSSTTSSIPYNYQATGTAQTTSTELKWDDTEPVGYYPWGAGDTMAITFDAYPGGTLDSLQVALRRAGSLAGGIYQLASSGASPLGALIVRDTATITTTSSVPYPVPYQNWTTVNLKGTNISTDQGFAVAFYGKADSTVPGLMITQIPGTSAYHNLTYLKPSDASPNPAGWYFIGNGTNISLYLVHAYVSFVTGVTKEVTPVPTAFRLSQNYPNPFNPSTEITYDIPKASQVRLSVFDILGRQVMVLVNKRQNQGHYTVSFDAAGLPSGIYFYRLSTDGNSAVKKMVVVK